MTTITVKRNLRSLLVLGIVLLLAGCTSTSMKVGHPVDCEIASDTALYAAISSNAYLYDCATLRL